MSSHCSWCPFLGCDSCGYQGCKPGVTSGNESVNVVKSGHNKTVPFSAGNASGDLTTERLIRSR